MQTCSNASAKLSPDIGFECVQQHGFDYDDGNGNNY